MPPRPSPTAQTPAGLFHSLFSSLIGSRSEADFEQRRAQQLKIMDVVREDANNSQQQFECLMINASQLIRHLTAVNEL